MKSPLGTMVRALMKDPPPYVSRGIDIPQRAGNQVETMMQAYGGVSTLFAIVSRLANGTSQVEWKLWRKAASGKDEDRVEVTSHAALDLWNRPNPFTTGQEFVEGQQQHVDLTGEGWWVIQRSARSALPLNMFYVRPDRIAPVATAKDFIAGYIYYGPQNEKIPLETNEVIQLKMPNPLDPFRGLGPVQAALIDLDSARYGAEWNRNFFLNDASPGGIVEVDRRLDDDEWEEMTTRWRQQHQGVANAHRVAVLEQGRWVERAFNARDMQFVEMRQLSREMIREAFAFPKPMLGSVDDVNRANAEAAKVVFAQDCLEPRLVRIRAALNYRLLPMYGESAARTLEFDFEDPTPEDRPAESARIKSAAEALKILVDAGVDGEEAMATVGLPIMTWERQVAPAPTAAPGPPQPAPAGTQARLRYQPFADLEEQKQHQLETIQQDWQQILDMLMGDWAGITEDVRTDVLAQVRAAIETGDPEALLNVQVPDGTMDAGGDLLASAMRQLAAIAAQRVVDEAASQGVSIGPIEIDQDTLKSFARTVAFNLAERLVLAARREAMRRQTPTSTVDEVVQGVKEHLESFTDREEKDLLGGALTNAQNTARIETLKAAPEASYYADETLDPNTCEFCKEVDGRYLGNSIEEVERMYPNGGYVECAGRERCRGTVVAVWRPTTVSEATMRRTPVFAMAGGPQLLEERLRAAAAGRPVQARTPRDFRIKNRTDAQGTSYAEVHLYAEVGYYGVTAAEFVSELKQLDVDEIDLHLNSPGGEVWDGITIYNALVRHQAKVIVYVDGIAASVASIIAMAGDERIMAEGSQMMIHDAWGMCVGNAADMAEMKDALDRESGNLASIYASRSGGTPAQWRKAMLAETWYLADEAVAAGLADKVEKTTRTGDGENVAARWDMKVFGWAKYDGREHAPAPALACAKCNVIQADHGDNHQFQAILPDGRHASVSTPEPPAQPSTPADPPVAAPPEGEGGEDEPSDELVQALATFDFGGTLRAATEDLPVYEPSALRAALDLAASTAPAVTAPPRPETPPTLTELVEVMSNSLKAGLLDAHS